MKAAPPKPPQRCPFISPFLGWAGEPPTKIDKREKNKVGSNFYPLKSGPRLSEPSVSAYQLQSSPGKNPQEAAAGKEDMPAQPARSLQPVPLDESQTAKSLALGVKCMEGEKQRLAIRIAMIDPI